MMSRRRLLSLQRTSRILRRDRRVACAPRLDQGIPRDTADLLRDAGFDCLHVGEIGMSRAEDREILSFSMARNAAVVTLDADFHTITAVSGAVQPSVIRVRVQGLDAVAVLEVVRRVLVEYSRDLEAGCLITVKQNKTTCHRLPIGGTGKAQVS